MKEQIKIEHLLIDAVHYKERIGKKIFHIYEFEGFITAGSWNKKEAIEKFIVNMCNTQLINAL